MAASAYGPTVWIFSSHTPSLFIHTLWFSNLSRLFPSVLCEFQEPTFFTKTSRIQLTATSSGQTGVLHAKFRDVKHRPTDIALSQLNKPMWSNAVIVHFLKIYRAHSSSFRLWERILQIRLFWNDNEIRASESNGIIQKRCKESGLCEQLKRNNLICWKTSYFHFCLKHIHIYCETVNTKLSNGGQQSDPPWPN